LERSGEEDHGRQVAARQTLDGLADLVTVQAGHDGVREHDIGLEFRERLDGAITRTEGPKLVAGLRKCELDHLLNGQTVIRQKDSVSHSVSSNGKVFLDVERQKSTSEAPEWSMR